MIYFVRAEKDVFSIKAGMIKIGTTVRLSERLKQIERDIGHAPMVLGVMDGSYADESSLHRKFEGFRRLGEWFEPHDLLAAFVETETRPWDGTDEVPMGRAYKITDDAYQWARIASGYTGESVAEYLSRIAVERGKEDTDKLHAKVKGAEAKSEAAHKKKGDKH